MNDPESPALPPAGEPNLTADELDASPPDEPRVGPDIDFTDPNSPLAPYYFQASHVLATFLIVAIFLFFNLMAPLWHSDIWGHLKIGEWIVANRQLPQRELFSPFSDPNLPASNFQWLSQVFLYETFHAGERLAGDSTLDQIAGGIDLLRAVHAFCEAAKAFLLLLAFRRFTSSLPFAVAGVVLVFAFSLAPSAIQRPQVFAEVLFAAVLWALSRPFRQAVALLPPSPPGTPGGEGRGEGGQNPSRILESLAGSPPSPPTPLPRSTGGKGRIDATLSWPRTFLIVALLILWVNVHGSFLIGLALVGIFWLGQTIESFRDHGLAAMLRDAPLHRPLAAVLVGTALLSILNPHGLHAIPDVLAFAKNPNILTMQEWQPLNFSAGGGGHWSYMILFALIVLTQIVSTRLYSPTQLLLLAFFGVLPVLQERLMTWWVLLVPVVLLPMWADLLVPSEELRERFTSILSLRKTIIAAGIVLVGLVWSSPVQLLLGHPPVPIDLSSSRATLWPVTQGLLNGTDDADYQEAEKRNDANALKDAKRFRKDPLAKAIADGLNKYPDHRFRGRIFTPEAMGDYLIWSLPPKAPVMVYSHVHVFPPDYWDDYMEVLFALPGWKTVLDRYGVNLVICQVEQRKDLLDALKVDPEWDVILDQSEQPTNRWYRLFVALRRMPR